MLSKGKSVSLQANKLVTEGQHKHLLPLRELYTHYSILTHTQTTSSLFLEDILIVQIQYSSTYSEH